MSRECNVHRMSFPQFWPLEAQAACAPHMAGLDVVAAVFEAEATAGEKARPMEPPVVMIG